MDEVLKKLEKHSRQQLLFTKILCVLCAAVLVCVLVTALSVTGAVRQLVTLAEPLQSLAAEAESVMGDLEEVTQTLAAADLGGMVDTINALASDSQSVVTDAMEKLDTIDIETLNKAIRDLSDVVEPLAKVSKIFG